LACSVLGFNAADCKAAVGSIRACSNTDAARAHADRTRGWFVTCHHLSCLSFLLTPGRSSKSQLNWAIAHHVLRKIK
jgi:hypothetical protein